MIQFDQIGFKTTNYKQGLDSTVKPVVPAVSSCQDHTKTCDTLNRRADLTQRALFGEMYNAVWGSAPLFRCWGRCWEPVEKNL